jgi:UDP-GlcNAc:undecaprenyl-phosphate GlcNAc-1-phosphate transferase
MIPGTVTFSALIAVLAGGLFLLAMPWLARALHLERQNFAREPVSTGYGMVLWLPSATALGWAGMRGLTGAWPAVTALVVFGLVGLADDLWGDRSAGGFRGHLRQLIEKGRLTTGLIKLAVGGGAALVLGLWLTGEAAPPLLRVLLEPAAPSTASLPPLPDLAPHPQPPWLGGMQVLASALVIALCANTLNLLDLRPLRSLKGFGLGALLLVLFLALPALGGLRLPLLPNLLARMPQWLQSFFMLFRPPAAGWDALGLLAPAVAAALLYAPLEARRRAMLGDTGANALGALLGVAACVALPPVALVLLGVMLLVLNLYCETRSLSVLIRSRPWLDRLDRWGWGGDEEVKR